MKDIRAAIIPHAGSEYSGAARQNAFKFFNDVNYIIYISAIHKSTNLNEKTYLLYKDGEFDKFDINLTKLTYT